MEFGVCAVKLKYLETRRLGVAGAHQVGTAGFVVRPAQVGDAGADTVAQHEHRRGVFVVGHRRVAQVRRAVVDVVRPFTRLGGAVQQPFIGADGVVPAGAVGQCLIVILGV